MPPTSLNCFKLNVLIIKLTLKQEFLFKEKALTVNVISL